MDKTPKSQSQNRNNPVQAQLSNENPNAHWYVIHTYSGHESKVGTALKQRIASLSLKEKIFPGYILIKMVLDDASWLAVRSTSGVTSFVGIGNRPTPLPDEEIKTIQQFMKMEAPKF